jgi:DNA primase
VAPPPLVMAISDDIKARLDIVDVVSKYVPALKQAGRNFKAPCPFHQEKTPSFVVFPDRQTWRCFGACATGGDAFSFVMRADGVDFPSALHQLAAEAGVEVPDRRAPDAAPRSPHVELNEQANRFFKDALASDRGSNVRAYLAGRGLGDEVIAAFGLGYGPANGDELARRLDGLGFSRERTVAAGLATMGDDGSVRDMFRGRLTFPIRNESGDVVGFGGRALDDTPPKYLNTPQTDAFDKSRLLYGLDRAREAIANDGRRAVVVEGYMDVIAAHEKGFRNVVASMGTALTQAQVDLLLARADTVVLALDADAAGQGAMFRSLLDLAQRNAGATRGRRNALRQRSMVFDVFRVARLPLGKDPDDLIRTDASLWRHAVDEASSLAEFLLDAAPAHMDLSTADAKAQAAEALREIVFSASWTEQDRYVGRLAKMLEVEAATLVAHLGRRPRAGAQRPARQAMAEPAEAATPFRRADGDPKETHLLALLVNYPELLPRGTELRADHFQRPENRALLSALQGGGTIEGTRSRLDGHLADLLDGLLILELPGMDPKQRTGAFDSCARDLEIRFLRDLKEQERMVMASDEEELGQAPDLGVNERLRELYTEGTKAP